MIEALFYYWLVYAAGYSANYIGPYPTKEVCEAAQKGAIGEGTLADCVQAIQYDDYMMMQNDRYENGEGGPW